jgi:hypothetical protein
MWMILLKSFNNLPAGRQGERQKKKRIKRTVFPLLFLCPSLIEISAHQGLLNV